MKKITDFIVDKRYVILILFILLGIVSGLLSRNVNINYDIAEYLPNTSETRIGMDIMEKEFSATKTSSLNLMFKDLPSDEKIQVCNYLKGINGVNSVDYDESEQYNKDNYTLYVITVSDEPDSRLATNTYKEITQKYSNYELYTSGDISQRNEPVLPIWIIGLAIFCALIILIIMSESYIEPFLFLVTILIAVLLNKGTNIIFHSVSNITDSIAAILQLALSMDYSIMLMNRYNQEKNKEADKVKAMKIALHNSFKSISSSSVTTIVGLMALVFMSFTIGKDLGFVLAKGVLFSLLSIFFVLPGLILIFDKLILKTKKRSPKITLDKLGKISYKCRYIAVPTFLIVFLVSFLLKGNLQIYYTNSEDDEISTIFQENNQIAIIYKTKDEEKISRYLKKLENENKTTEVLGYSNTINQKLKYDELNEKLNDLGSDVNIESYLLKILYYNYYNTNESNTMTFSQFVAFIKNEVYNNPKMSDKIDDETKVNIDKLEYFTTKESINKKRNAEEIASILEIEKEKVDDILIYYSSKNSNIEISLNEFIKFMNKDVLTNEKYSSNIDSKSRENLNTLSKFTSKSVIQKKMPSSEMAKLFGINENTMNDLYTYYISVNEINTKMTISEFANFVLTDVLNNSKYSNSFDNSTKANIQMIATFSNTNIISKQMLADELSSLCGIDKENILKVLLLKYSNQDTKSKISLTEFINCVMYLKNNTNYLTGIDVSNLQKLYVFAKNENNINTTKMNKTALSKIFNNVSKGLVEKIYVLANLPDDYLMTPQEFVNFIINTLNSQSGNTSGLKFSENELNNLKLLKMVIDDSISSNRNTYTATELSNILGINSKQMYSLYTLIDFLNGKTDNWKASPNELINLILLNGGHESIKNSIDENTMNKLKLLSSIMESSIQGKTYSYKEISELMGIDSNKVKSIYTLYVSNKQKTKLTPQEFANFVLEHKNDSILSSNLSSSTISSLQTVKSAMEGCVNGKKYKSSELSNLLKIDKESLDLLYGLYNTKYINTNLNMSLKDFVSFLLTEVITNDSFADNFDTNREHRLNCINSIMEGAITNTKYTKDEIFAILGILTETIDKDTIDLLYTYYGSENEYNYDWTLTVEEFVKFLNDNILNDTRFDKFIEDDMRKNIISSKDTINDAKDLLIGKEYSRIILNTNFDLESEETFNFIKELREYLVQDLEEIYIIGDSPMAYEMSGTFNGELDYITILTMIAILIVVAITFKSMFIPILLVIIIQCAVYMTMGILSFSGEGVYFIALLIVQSILMGATIDYAILYTSYYIEHRKNMEIKEAIINSYNKSIHTILTSASILVIVTLIVGHFASAIAAKICKTISQGTLCSTILILCLLPAILAACDKIIIKKHKSKK